MRFAANGRSTLDDLIGAYAGGSAAHSKEALPALQAAPERSRSAIANLWPSALPLAINVSALLPRLLWPNRVIRSVNRYPGITSVNCERRIGASTGSHLNRPCRGRF